MFKYKSEPPNSPLASTVASLGRGSEFNSCGSVNFIELNQFCEENKCKGSISSKLWLIRLGQA